MMAKVSNKIKGHLLLHTNKQPCKMSDATAQCNLGIASLSTSQYGHNEQPDLIRARYYYEQAASQQDF
jgi:TPR repeat protein